MFRAKLNKLFGIYSRLDANIPCNIIKTVVKHVNGLLNAVEIVCVLQFMHGKVSVDCSKVLEHMKTQGMPLNENVLNALVKGHIIKG